MILFTAFAAVGWLSLEDLESWYAGARRKYSVKVYGDKKRGLVFGRLLLRAEGYNILRIYVSDRNRSHYFVSTHSFLISRFIFDDLKDRHTSEVAIRYHAVGEEIIWYISRFNLWIEHGVDYVDPISKEAQVSLSKSDMVEVSR